MLKLVKFIVLILMHIFFLGVIFYCFWPISTWYLNHRPILGVDFYHTATWIKFFKENLHFIQQNYVDFWYGGTQILSYPIINWFRVFAIVAHILPVHTAIKLTSLGVFFLSIIFVYLGTHRLSGNPFVAVTLAILVMFSSNMYGSLTWGGSLPYFANQLFFPLILWLMACFLESGSRRWYYFGILALGFAITGHIGNASAFFLPSVLTLILFGQRNKPVGIITRLKEVFVYIIILDVLVYRYIGQFWLILINIISTLLSGLSLIKVPSFSHTSSTTLVEPSAVSNINQQIAQFYRNSFYKVFTDTNQLLLVGLGIAIVIFLIAFTVSRRKTDVLGFIAWTIVCVYSVLHVYLNANGISFLSQGWYRAFWQFPVTLAFLIASFVGSALKGIRPHGKVAHIGFFTICSVIAITAGIVSVTNHDSQKTIAIVENQSSPSSAYPEALNLFKSDAEFARLKNSLLPSWMSANEKNYRFFSDDAQVIVWWNALFDIPQARGYLDAPGNTNQHHLLDQAIAGNGLMVNYKYDENIAHNMALYYLDWYAIKYFEGGHVSQSPNKTPSTYLKDAIAQTADVETKGVTFVVGTKSGKPEIHDDVSQFLKYYRFKDEITSPIVTISNAPTLACFCDFPAYESLVKILSMHNIHSRMLVSLYIPESIDSYSLELMKKFDVVLLSNYKYNNRNKTFSLLKNYLEQGGKLLFDTGGEVKESESKNLPEWFPFRQSERKGLGREWNLDFEARDETFQDVDVPAFAPPLFDKNEWSFSFPLNSVKPESVVLLKQNSKPLLIRSKVGLGTLYWSGMNLVYHIQYYTNLPESNLFMRILTALVPLELHDYTQANPNFEGSNVINIKSPSSGRGILIKRQMFDDWSAIVKGQRLKLIKSGPSFPGFIYIPLDNKGSVEGQIRYEGNKEHYIYWILTAVMGLLLFDLSILNGSLLMKQLRKLYGFFRKKTASWWEKEGE